MIALRVVFGGMMCFLASSSYSAERRWGECPTSERDRIADAVIENAQVGQWLVFNCPFDQWRALQSISPEERRVAAALQGTGVYFAIASAFGGNTTNLPVYVLSQRMRRRRQTNKLQFDVADDGVMRVAFVRRVDAFDSAAALETMMASPMLDAILGDSALADLKTLPPTEFEKKYGLTPVYGRGVYSVVQGCLFAASDEWSESICTQPIPTNGLPTAKAKLGKMADKIVIDKTEYMEAVSVCGRCTEDDANLSCGFKPRTDLGKDLEKAFERWRGKAKNGTIEGQEKSR